MPAELLARWKEFYREEPFGFEWDELRFGRLNSTVANFRPFRTADSPILRPADFMTDPDPLPPPSDEQRIAVHKSRAIAWAKGTGGYREPAKKEPDRG